MSNQYYRFPTTDDGSINVVHLRDRPICLIIKTVINGVEKFGSPSQLSDIPLDNTQDALNSTKSLAKTADQVK